VTAAASHPLVLASGSSVRRRLMENAGLAFHVDPANVDEENLKAAIRAEGGGAAEIAETLAEMKAVTVSRRHPEALVIGADQTLDCNGMLFDKPADRDHARGHLRALAGRTHTLHSSVCIVERGARLWHENAAARLTMRPLSETFIDDYLRRAGDDICECVGAYRLEGIGVQLFQRIDGDFFTILGLPLLPLLTYLRQRRALAA